MDLRQTTTGAAYPFGANRRFPLAGRCIGGDLTPRSGLGRPRRIVLIDQILRAESGLAIWRSLPRTRSSGDTELHRECP
jgi:hypothetical protein